MEYVPNGSLAQFYRAHGLVSSKVAKALIAQLVLALEYIHSHQICHRDLKLENLLLD